MKRLLQIITITLIMCSCNTSPTYTINGTIDTKYDGETIILTTKNDTINHSVISDGGFTMTGSVKLLTPAYISVVGEQGYPTTIFLENVEFTTKIDIQNPATSQIKGGDAQAIANEFNKHRKEYTDKKEKLSKMHLRAIKVDDKELLKGINNQISEIDKVMDSLFQKTAQKFSDSEVTAFFMDDSKYKYSLEKAKKMLNTLTDKARNSRYGATLADYINKLDQLQVNKEAPDFTQNDVNGNPISLSSIKGKAKIIDFWASWCSPCRKANPELVALYKKYHSKGLEIISVSLDRQRDNWVAAINNDNLTWPQVSDLQGWDNEVADQYSVMSLPTLYLLSQDNIIMSKNLHGMELENSVKALLGLAPLQ